METGHSVFKNIHKYLEYLKVNRALRSAHQIQHMTPPSTVSLNKCSNGETLFSTEYSKVFTVENYSEYSKKRTGDNTGHHHPPYDLIGELRGEKSNQKQKIQKNSEYSKEHNRERGPPPTACLIKCTNGEATRCEEALESKRLVPWIHRSHKLDQRASEPHKAPPREKSSSQPDTQSLIQPACHQVIHIYISIHFFIQSSQPLNQRVS